MLDYLNELEYIKEKLLFIKLKVNQNTSLGLFDINTVGEDLFMHLLNAAYGFKLENANDSIHENYPAIDLIDYTNKLLIQVTSTKDTKKVYYTIKKKESLKDKIIASFPLKICYIADKPEFSEKQMKNIENKGLLISDLLGIDDIYKVAQSDINKRKAIYDVLKQRLDSKAYTFDINGHFNKFETQLIESTTNKFFSYKKDFYDFLSSDDNILEISAVGGNGKSHLLRYLSNLESTYIPVLFTKQTNVESDLKNLDLTKRYLFIYDDIDRFLDSSIESIFSTLICNNSKMIISYRSASHYLVEEKILKFNELKSKTISIKWNEKDIKELILKIKPNTSLDYIEYLNTYFNSNPYLITQAILDKFDNIKDASKKLIKDAENILSNFNMSKKEIEELLFRVALLSPCTKDILDVKYNDKINYLIKSGILRELNNKVRFNPDILGDLFLHDFIRNNEYAYKQIVNEYIQTRFESIITNLTYSLSYENNNGLELFKHIINDWIENKDYRSSNLKTLYKIAKYVPFEAFYYLNIISNKLTPKENKHIKLKGIDAHIPQVKDVDFNESDDYINLGSIVPIVNVFINELKNEKDLGRLKMKQIINFAVSKKILSFPKPYYSNHSLYGIFKMIIFPFYDKNNNVIIEAFNEMEKWIFENPINISKLNILETVLNNILEGTVLNLIDNKMIDIDTSKENINKILNKAKSILFKMLNTSCINLKCSALNIISYIGNHPNYVYEKKNELFYQSIIEEIIQNLNKQIISVNDYKFLSKLDEELLKIIAYRKNKDSAFNLFIKIPRDEIFVYNQLLNNKSFIVYDLNEFKKDFNPQKDIKELMTNKYSNTRHHKIISKEKVLYDSFIKEYTTPEKFICFINSLNIYENYINSYKLNTLLENWYKKEPHLFKALDKDLIIKIKTSAIKDIVYNFLVLKKIFILDLDSFDETTSIKKLKNYVELALNTDNLLLYDKLFKIFKEKEKEDIFWFINESFSFFHRTIKDSTLLRKYNYYINELLNLVIKYKIPSIMYLTFMLKDLHKKNIPLEYIKNKLYKLVHIDLIENNKNRKFEYIEIEEHDLQIIFNILDYKLEDIIARIFIKSFKINFSVYTSENNIIESKLLKNYINDYEDYKTFINIIIEDYYKNFSLIINNEDGSTKEFKPDINYFFIDTKLSSDYLKKYIKELIIKNNKTYLQILLHIIPLKIEYKELYLKILDLFEPKDFISTLKKNSLFYKKLTPYEYILKNMSIQQFKSYDYISSQINEEIELFSYIHDNLSNFDSIFEIKKILDNIIQIKNSLAEINTEHKLR